MVRQRSERQTPLYLDQIASEWCDGAGGAAIRNGGASRSSLLNATRRSARDRLSLTRARHRQGYSSPPKDAKVKDRNAGTRIVCPARNWARRDGRKWTKPRAELP